MSKSEYSLMSVIKRSTLNEYLSLLALFVMFQLSAQTSILGHLNFERDHLSSLKVHLVKQNIDAIEDLKYAEPVAWSQVDRKGSFTFDRKHISDKNAAYRLFITKMEKAVNDTIARSKVFILSQHDSIYFSKGADPLGTYVSTNKADKELGKLQDFEAELSKSRLDERDEASRLQSYARDSLRILMVKLIGIKQLDEKQLLEQDIAENPSYYLDILVELKESEIEPEQYLFLEKKLAFLTQEIVEEKYAWSKTVNFILAFMVLGLIAAVLILRRKKQPVMPDLSRQERTVRNLILEGKTNKEIAAELFISLSTVKTHITHIYRKLKVSNRKELLRKMHN